MTTMYYGNPLVTLTFEGKNASPQNSVSSRYKKIITEGKGREMLESRFFSNSATLKKVTLILATAHDFTGKRTALYGELFFCIHKASKMCPHYAVPEIVLQNALDTIQKKKIIVATQSIRICDTENKCEEYLFLLTEYAQGKYRLGSIPVRFDTIFEEDDYILVLEQGR